MQGPSYIERSKVRTRKLALPLLVAVPWVGSGVENGKFWQRKKKPDVEKETVSV